MKRIVLATFGSYGDLNPYIAIGVALRHLGAEVCVVAPEPYRGDILRHGLEFIPTRPEVDVEDTGLIGSVMNPWAGAEFLTRKLLMPALRESYEDLFAACEGADFLLSHVLVLAAPIVAEQKRIPWATAFLQPMVLFSAYDMPVIPPLTGLRYLRSLGPRFNKAVLRLLFTLSAHWGQPVHQLRRDLGLPPGPNPLFDAYRSPFGNLALFAEVYASAQPDWPVQTELCGFPFLDEDLGGTALQPETDEFTRAGARPVVFTLGSAAVRIAHEFIRRVIEISGRLRERAIIVIGEQASERDLHPTKDVLLVPSLPYFEVFPRASVIVHSGGIGTTAHALRAGVPQIIVPFAHDQFDNADRIARLHCGINAGSRRISSTRLTKYIQRAITDTSYTSAAENIADRISTDGAQRAAKHLLSIC